MNKLQVYSILKNDIRDIIIPSDKVANVLVGNNLEHALLVLTKSGYTAVPVLDTDYKLHGLISTPLILDATLGLERIEFENLEHIKVEEVMHRDIPYLKLDDPFERALNLLINNPFLCVVDDDFHFEGILTRRVILIKLAAFLHQNNR